MPTLRPDAPLSPELAARFFGWLRIMPSGCWEWTRTLQKDGYGQLSIGGKHYVAHRLSYLLFVGPIGDGLFVCHHCDNRLCCNPSHLFEGTQSDNIRDCYAKGRANNAGRIRSHCKRGHVLTADNLTFVQGGRRCRVCREAYLSAHPTVLRPRATKTHCGRGHEWAAPDNLVIRDGRRRCRACMRERQQKYRDARRQRIAA